MTRQSIRAGHSLAVWSGSGQWDNWLTGGYTIYNNIWGTGAGSRTTWARPTAETLRGARLDDGRQVHLLSALDTTTSLVPAHRDAA
jgi:hypothetical protein